MGVRIKVIILTGRTINVTILIRSRVRVSCVVILVFAFTEHLISTSASSSIIVTVTVGFDRIVDSMKFRVGFIVDTFAHDNIMILIVTNRCCWNH